MTAGLRVGIAQWTPGLDPGVNLRTAGPVDGGSRVIAPDGRTVASAPRYRDLVSA
jgi:hypothetical protein